MATYMSYYRVKYRDERQSGRADGQRPYAAETNGSSPQSVSGVVSAVYGTGIVGEDAEPNRRS